MTRKAILFADITDSTKLYEDVGDARAREMTAACMAAMVKAVADYDGVTVKTMGDGLLAAFPTADAACDAAVDMQTATEGGKLTIRVAFHFGPIIDERGDVFGDTVNLASRVANLTRPGEILTTEETATLLTGIRQGATSFFGTTAVKGKAHPVRLFTVQWQEEDSDRTMALSSSAVRVPDLPEAVVDLSYHTASLRLDTGRQMAVLGRDARCDMVVAGQFVSRHHCRIDMRGDKFLIADQSTNGTYVQLHTGELVVLRREALQLVGSGIISLGEVPEGNNDVVAYRVSSPEERPQ